MPLLAGLDVLHAIQLHLITSDASAFHLLRMRESLLLKKHLYAQTQRSSLNPSHHTWSFIVEDVCTQVNIRSLSRWLSRQQDQTLHRATRLIANPDLPPPLNLFHLQAFLSCFLTSCPFYSWSFVIHLYCLPLPSLLSISSICESICPYRLSPCIHFSTLSLNDPHSIIYLAAVAMSYDSLCIQGACSKVCRAQTPFVSPLCQTRQ